MHIEYGMARLQQRIILPNSRLTQLELHLVSSLRAGPGARTLQTLHSEPLARLTTPHTVPVAGLVEE